MAEVVVDRKRRARSLIAAGTPVLLTISMILVPSALSSQPLRLSKLVWLVQKSGMTFAGGLVPLVDFRMHGWWISLLGWTLVTAWLVVVIKTRVGDWPWTLHAALAAGWMGVGVLASVCGTMGV